MVKKINHDIRPALLAYIENEQIAFRFEDLAQIVNK